VRGASRAGAAAETGMAAMTRACGCAEDRTRRRAADDHLALEAYSYGCLGSVQSDAETLPDARELATWERFIEPVLGSRDVSELTHHELKKWLANQVTMRGTRGQTKDGDEKDQLRRARYTANRR
jgi:hypothetical protein